MGITGTPRQRAHPTGRNELDPNRKADLDAVERCLAGDREAFGEIAERESLAGSLSQFPQDLVRPEFLSHQPVTNCST